VTGGDETEAPVDEAERLPRGEALDAEGDTLADGDGGVWLGGGLRRGTRHQCRRILLPGGGGREPRPRGRVGLRHGVGAALHLGVGVGLEQR
jgi:hypothetical protein